MPINNRMDKQNSKSEVSRYTCYESEIHNVAPSQTQKTAHCYSFCICSIQRKIHKKQKYTVFKVKKRVTFLDKGGIEIWRWHSRGHLRC